LTLFFINFDTKVILFLEKQIIFYFFDKKFCIIFVVIIQVNYMKTLFQLILLTVCLTFTFILLSAILPYSETFKSLSNHIELKDTIYLLIVSFWICLTVLYVTKAANNSESRVALTLSFSLFFIYGLMSSIDNLFFGNPWVVLAKKDLWLQIIGSGIAVLFISILGVKLFGVKYKLSKYSRTPKNFTLLELVIKVILVGMTYVILYFTLNYFVRWEVTNVRVVYAGSYQFNDFMNHLLALWNNQSLIYIFQFIKGILFGIFILPIVYLFRKNSIQMLTVIFLIFGTTALFQLVPNYLIPTDVQLGAFLEISCLMFLFSLFTCLIFNKINLSSNFINSKNS
jgi:hypothetical protein